MSSHNAAPEQRMAYVARIKECGCVVAASVDLPEYAGATAKFVAKEIREGFNVERMPVENARALPWGWPCEHMKRAAAGIAEGQEALIV